MVRLLVGQSLRSSKNSPIGNLMPPAMVRTACVHSSESLVYLMSSKTGTGKFFNATQGYGFIAPEDQSKDVFVHISAVERAGLGTLTENQKVGFDLERGQNGKISATNLKAI